MIARKTITIPARPAIPETRTDVEDGLICDLCGSHSVDLDWDDAKFNRHRVEVKEIFGNVYDEGGGVTEIIVDLCPACFTNALLPWLKTQGMTGPRTKEFDV